MSVINVGEAGNIVRVNFGEDISTATVTMTFTPENGTGKTVTPTVPNVNVIDNNEVTYCASEYAEYALKSTDIDKPGRWTKSAKAEFSASNIKITNPEKFRVI